MRTTWNSSPILQDVGVRRDVAGVAFVEVAAGLRVEGLDDAVALEDFRDGRAEQLGELLVATRLELREVLVDDLDDVVVGLVADRAAAAEQAIAQIERGEPRGSKSWMISRASLTNSTGQSAMKAISSGVHER